MRCSVNVTLYGNQRREGSQRRHRGVMERVEGIFYTEYALMKRKKVFSKVTV